MNAFFRKLLPLAILLAAQSPAHAGVLKDHPGHWMGDMKLPDGRTLKIGAEFFTRADGSAWASFASPDQAGYDIPVKSVKETADSVELDFHFATMKMTWDKDHFNGEYKQGKEPLTLELKQVAAFPMKVRPQTPKAPFPYKDETLAITSKDGVTLGATLSLPKGTAHPNVVVLVHGSGPNTRDMNIDGHHAFAVLADYLARRGVAVLRYDKRGIARSTGDYDQHTAAHLADDLTSVVQAMKARRQFKRVGMLGLSEGPGIAAAVAARHPQSVDFVVSLAGVGLPGLEMMLLQDHVWAQSRQATPAEMDRLMVYVRNYYEVLLASTDDASRIAALKALYQGLPPEDQALVKKYEMNQGTLSLGWANKPFLRATLLADTPADWRAVRCPVLVLNGSLDHQVPAAENLGGIVAALRAGGNKQLESAILPSLNHLFQTAKTGREDEYVTIEETMAPTVLQRIAVFVKKQR